MRYITMRHTCLCGCGMYRDTLIPLGEDTPPATEDGASVEQATDGASVGLAAGPAYPDNRDRYDRVERRSRALDFALRAVDGTSAADPKAVLDAARLFDTFLDGETEQAPLKASPPEPNTWQVRLKYEYQELRDRMDRLRSYLEKSPNTPDRSVLSRQLVAMLVYLRILAERLEGLK